MWYSVIPIDQSIRVVFLYIADFSRAMFVILLAWKTYSLYARQKENLIFIISNFFINFVCFEWKVCIT